MSSIQQMFNNVRGEARGTGEVCTIGGYQETGGSISGDRRVNEHGGVANGMQLRGKASTIGVYTETRANNLANSNGMRIVEGPSKGGGVRGRGLFTINGNTSGLTFPGLAEVVGASAATGAGVLGAVVARAEI